MKLLSKTDRKALGWCLALTAIWRVGLEVINQMIVPYISPPGYDPNRGLPSPGLIDGFKRWLNWDGSWYRTIVEHGYIIVHHLRGPETIAFFPFFPYTVKLIHRVIYFVPAIFLGLGMNFILVVLTAFFVYKLTYQVAQDRHANPGRLAKIATICLFLNPASYFLAGFYSEPILLFCVTLGIYCALNRRYWLAAILAAAASATKSDGAVLGIAIVLMYIQNEKPDKMNLNFIKESALKLIGLLLVSVSGLVAFLAYIWARFGSPLVGIQNEKYWSRREGNFIYNIYKYEYGKIGNIYFFGSKINFLYHLYLMAIPFIIIAIAIYLVTKQRNYWLLFLTLGFLLVPLSSGLLLSLNRYVLAITPLTTFFIVEYSKKITQLKQLIIITFGFFSAILLFIFTAAFLAGYFVG